MTGEEKNEIIKKIDELLELCQYRNVPMFVTVAMEDDGSTTTYYNRMHSAKSHNIHLSDDQISKHILIADGFSAVPPRESLEVEMDELLTGLSEGE